MENKLVPVRRNGKFGYADETGREIIPCKYDFAKPFKGNLAAVNLGGQRIAALCMGGKWGFVNKAGIEVIPCQYDSIELQVEKNVME